MLLTSVFGYIVGYEFKVFKEFKVSFVKIKCRTIFHKDETFLKNVLQLMICQTHGEKLIQSVKMYTTKFCVMQV